MNERRRIIIPTGVDPNEPLRSPHFDAEATMTARPVIPLAEQQTSQIRHGDYAGHATRPFWKRHALLALIVLTAVGVGAAAGLVIGIYRNRSAAATTVPAASAPAAPVESVGSGPTVEPTPVPQPSASVPEKPAETAAVEKDEELERTARNEKKRDEVTPPPPPPVVRDKKQEKAEKDDDADEVLEERQAERERRREERRERRRRQRDDDEAIDVPRGIERAQREIDRIRDIFEGRQP
ncbi:MAG TPA: hypothetical protein VF791_20435 [Pyrinomonadaceae bacterium]